MMCGHISYIYKTNQYNFVCFKILLNALFAYAVYFKYLRLTLCSSHVSYSTWNEYQYQMRTPKTIKAVFTRYAITLQKSKLTRLS